MGNSLGSIFVNLKANTADFIAGMSKASYVSKQTANEIKSGFGEMGQAIQGALGQFGQFGSTVGSLTSEVSAGFEGLVTGTGGVIVGIAGIAAAGVAAAAGLAAMAVEGAELVENLSNISQKTGISIRDLQTFQAAGATVGVSLDDMVTGLRKFDQSLTGAGKGAGYAALVLRNLGVTSTDAKEALLQAADGFAAMEDGPRKAADAVALFGKSGLTLIPLLNQGREGILAMSGAVDEFGGKVTGNAIAATEKYKKGVEDLSLAWDSFKINLVSTVGPVLTDLTKQIAGETKAVGDFTSALLAHPGNTIFDYVTGVLANGGSLQAGVDAVNAGIGARAPGGGPASAADTAKAAAIAKAKTEQKELNDSAMAYYEILKDGGQAAYALEQKRADVAAAIQAGDGEAAATLQAQIPALQKAADLEKEQLAILQHNLEIRTRISELINAGGYKGPTGKSYTRTPQTAAQQAASIAAAPDVADTPSSFNLGAITGAKVKPEGMDQAQAALADFYKEWTADAKKTEDDVNGTYNDQLKTLQAYYTLGEISQQQFNDASIALEKARALAIQDVWKQSDGFEDQFKSFIIGVGDQGKDVAKSFFADLSQGLDALNGQLAKFIATGKGLDLKKLGQGLEGSLVNTGLKKVESEGAGLLGGLFGVKTGKRGDTATNAMFVTPVDASGNIVGSLAGSGAIGDLPLGANPSAGLSGLLSQIPGAGGGSSSPLGFLGPLLGFMGKFGGFLADGGQTSPGKTYIVGEDHPEFFTPSTHGQVAPSLRMSGGKPAPVINFHVNGVSDMDSFKRSQPQIASGLAQQLAIASSRSRG